MLFKSLICICLLAFCNAFRSFEFVNKILNYEEANQFCSTRFGTTLASVRSIIEQNRVYELCGERNCWIGLNDIDNEGVFEWEDGFDGSFTNFAPGEPNSFGGNEDCIHLRDVVLGQWNDADCNNQFYFVCNAAGVSPFDDIINGFTINEFRTLDGIGNNLLNDNFGIHNGPIIRVLPNGFADGKSEPARQEQSSARIISNIVSESIEADTTDSDVGLSNLAWLFGQFLDHELVEQTASMEDIPETRLDETEICIPIPVNDPFFVDPSQECVTFIDNADFDDNELVDRAINIVTAFIDASAVYGSEPDRIDFLRNADGTMKVSQNVNGDINLPFNTFGIPNSGGADRQDLFVTGEPRVNENIALTAMHTLWVREHNRLVNEIKNANAFLTGDELFEYARAVNGAQLQHVVYNEWLPAFFGEYLFEHYIDVDAPYDDQVDASIAGHISFVTFRVGHTLITDELSMRLANCEGNEGISLLDAFTQPAIIENGDNIVDKLLMGLSCTDARNIDPFIIPTLRNLLQFGVNGNTDPMDLMAINIARARDDGMVDYATMRELFGLQRPQSFGDIRSLFLNADIENRIQTAYNNDINVIDPIVGAFAERHVTGSAFGELQSKSFAEQFQRLINGDRFYYRRYLKGNLLRYVKSVTMQDIVRRNSDPITTFLPNHQFIFNAPGKGRNEAISFRPIRNAGGLCLDLYFGDSTNGNIIQTFECDLSDKQLWYYNTESKEIINVNGKCLAVKPTDFDNNSDPSEVVIWDCNGQINQKWFIRADDPDRHVISWLGQCLNVKEIALDGSKVLTGECVIPAIDNQKWFLLGNLL